LGNVLNQTGKKSIILYIISGETAPNFVIRNAFENNFYPCYEFDWVGVSSRIGQAAMHREFIDTLKKYRPDYCFMQLQNPATMDTLTIREMAKYTRIVQWSGDVRNSTDWYEWVAAIGKEIHLTLFSNETDVEKMREMGVKADYLQVGFDHIYYQRRKKINGWPDIVFVANDYSAFDLSDYRAEIVTDMYKLFPGQFRVFGRGWQRFGIHTEPISNGLEAECYNSCKIALSISSFAYKRYYSDRLLRIMGSGCCAISHCFPDLEKDFTPGYDIVTFTNKQDLLAKCQYYLFSDDERSKIADQALNTAHSKCTWDTRCQELLELLDRYE